MKGSDWVNNPCEYGCDCGECYSRSPDQEDSHHCEDRPKVIANEGKQP